MDYRRRMQLGRWLAVALVGLVALAALRSVASAGSHESGTIVLLAQTQAPAACCPSKPSAADPDRLVLNPKQFAPPVRAAYQAAQDNPALFMQLHCYCGCDRTAGHKNLLDCYRDMHGATCGTCTGEALQAKQMFEQGATIDAIRAALRARFGNS